MSMIRIAHMSDTQIRNLKRHWEYRKSYENLYISLREQKPDIIVYAGDIVHNKTQISPEQVDLCSEHFNHLATIAPTIIIPGNHDGNLNNLSRMDALTPIIKALNNRNIYYYKNSGIYPLPNAWNGNIVVFSCFDENWPSNEEIKNASSPINNQITIGLFHGMVQGAVLQNGQLVEDSPHKLKDFLDKVDYLMLGDIHKMQILDHEYRSAYCGSYPQQNYGETVDKGYLLWNIESKTKHTVDFVKLANVCPFYTLQLENDLRVPDGVDFQQNSRIRVFSRPLSLFEKKFLFDTINQKWNPHDLIFLDDVNVQRQEIKLLSSTDKIEDLGDVSVQERLIKHFLSTYNLTEDVISEVLDINKIFNTQAREEDEIFRNVQYKLGKMHFSNLFSYGEDNVFDFSKYSGIVGIFGKNAVGKSSLVVDIPLYTMFNKISKKGVVKNDLIINENKEDCGSQLEITVGQDKYVVRRATHVYQKAGKPQGKTDVEFEIRYRDGLTENKNGEERNVTDKNIRKVFGNAEDFVATSMAPQWQLLGLIEAGGTDRQKLIGRYFDIDIFAQKHKMANDAWKEIKGQLKLYENRNFEQELNSVEKDAQEQKELSEQFQEKKKAYDVKVKELENDISNLQSSVVKVQISKFDELQNHSFVEKKKQKIAILKKKIEDNSDVWEKKKKIDINSLIEKRDKWGKIRNLERLITKLENGCGCKHQENCSIHHQIYKYREEVSELRTSLDISDQEIGNQIGQWNELNPETIHISVAELKDVEVELLNLEKQKENFEKNKEQIAKNAKIEKEIEEFVFQKDSQLREWRYAEEQFVQHFGSYSRFCALKEEIEKSKAIYENIKKEYEVYHYFLSAMSKDGIVKQIIADNLDVVNSEIKKILSKGVGFSVELVSEEDGKAVEIYFTHERSKKRRIELCSGMEKTIAAIAIRAALINVTTLPRSNVFVLDEVFTALDPEYMDGIAKILEYLKQLFDSVIIITHIESFKDLVDHVVEIERDDEGYSKICEGF